MKLLRIIGMGLSAAILVACATENNYSLAVRSWQGGNENALFRAWGYPDRIQRINGQRILVYRSVDKGRNPTFTSPGQTTVESGGGTTIVTSSPTVVSGGGTYHYYCTTWFAVNKAGRIVNTSFRGNNCVADKSFVERLSRRR
ncbi:MAG: hypothetical protein K0U29_03900 [Gammaproteobacteria bacterium]|nr:hypothetical protein [Gammaproteobacteria bacterium]